ncbi:hypothetical protein Acsp05_24170 [Actinokineospora sp. NBRC 105648]|nr:hypothetical protein Acsp05_24170 [Actinokineospora sp. NBRC 105648]
MRVAVVGGGISGLVAAHRLRELLGPDARITVVEQSDRLGGKIRTVDLAGHRYDVGAEAYLARRPEVPALLAELGLLDRATHPTPARSTVRAGGVTRLIPGGTVMGVPTNPDSVADLLSTGGLRQVAAESTLPPLHLDGDVALGPLLRARFGDELPARLIDPLLGGVYAGGVDSLGLRATLPTLAAALDAGATSLTEAAGAALAKAAAPPDTAATSVTEAAGVSPVNAATVPARAASSGTGAVSEAVGVSPASAATVPARAVSLTAGATSPTRAGAASLDREAEPLPLPAASLDSVATSVTEAADPSPASAETLSNAAVSASTGAASATRAASVSPAKATTSAPSNFTLPSARVIHNQDPHPPVPDPSPVELASGPAPRDGRGHVLMRGGGAVFGTLVGGLGELVGRLAEGLDVRLGVPVRAVERDGRGWRVRLGANAPGHEPAESVLDVDAVVLAVPAPAARKLLDGVVPAASAAYGRVGVASMAVVALALPEGAELPGTSGVLLGARERRLDGSRFAVKAFTFSAAKWAHLGADAVIVRGSVGRFGDPGALKAGDDELVRLVRADLMELTGVTAPPIDAVVTRWGGGLPQYAAGHTELVAEIERAVAAEPGLAVAGATLHGVGIPACVATGEAAARRVATHLGAAVAG